MSDTEYTPSGLITEEVRAATMAKLEQAQATFADQLYVLEALDGHRVVEVGNRGYYRSDVHCSCAAEWWAGAHEGDPSHEAMWNIHRAEVIAGALAAHDVQVAANTLTEWADKEEAALGTMHNDSIRACIGSARARAAELRGDPKPSGSGSES